MNATVFQMACRGQMQGKARCRNMVDGAGTCHQHQEAVLAFPPTTILVKVKINQKWIDRLAAAGIGWKSRDQAALEAKHAAEAESLGRKADAFRATPDSGTPVFTKEGAGMVGMDDLFNRLPNLGFRLCWMHMYRRPQDTQMANLVLEYGFQADSNVSVPACVRDLICNCTWEHVHVWANPTQADHRTVHTVNLVHRLPDARPQCQLEYDHGYWNLSSLQS